MLRMSYVNITHWLSKVSTVSCKGIFKAEHDVEMNLIDHKRRGFNE